MDYKNVTKTQLRDFVDNKISKRKTELYDEIKKIIAARMGEAMKELLGDVSELERLASRFEDLLTEKIHAVGADFVPDYAKITASNANKLCNANKYFLDEIVSKAMSVFLNPRSYAFKCKPLISAFNDLSTELQPKMQLYREGLETLKRELNNAITLEPTGKRGYNALVAFGVDMSDLEDVNPNLPAVVKLSVDVCALNGDCEKKVSA